MSEPSESELLEAVKESLDKDGRLNKFKAEVRAAVMSVLNQSASNQKKPEIPHETGLLNELIREYLDWNGYRYSEQILVAESGLPSEQMKRDVLNTTLGVMGDAKTTKIPLLYYILSDYVKKQL